MSVFSGSDTNWSRLLQGFERWIQARSPDYVASSVAEMRAASSGSGFSNESHFAILAHPTDGESRQERIIVRTGPEAGAPTFFPNFDLEQQYRITKALHDNTSLPVPTCRWFETDRSIFGSPFYIMEFIPGDIPLDFPLHTTAGFLAEATDAQRNTLWWSTIDALADVANLDWRAAGLDFLDLPEAADGRAKRLVSYWESYFRWAIGEAAWESFSEAEEILSWLRANAPMEEPVGLVWGDSRFGNVIYRDFRPVALLDWEMATIGNPECDLAYLLFHETMNVAGNNNPADVRPRLGGFPSHAETIERYEQLTGRPASHLPYYWALNGFKIIALSQRAYSFMAKSGMISNEDAQEARKLPIFVEWIRAAMDGHFPVA